MLEPLAVEPRRSVAPAANSIASARLVFPAPAGPTSAITRVPLDCSPAMRLSLRPVHGRARRFHLALGRLVEDFTVRRFSSVGKGERLGRRRVGPDNERTPMASTAKSANPAD